MVSTPVSLRLNRFEKALMKLFVLWFLSDGFNLVLLILSYTELMIDGREELTMAGLPLLLAPISLLSHPLRSGTHNL